METVLTQQDIDKLREVREKIIKEQQIVKK